MKSNHRVVGLLIGILAYLPFGVQASDFGRICQLELQVEKKWYVELDEVKLPFDGDAQILPIELPDGEAWIRLTSHPNDGFHYGPAVLGALFEVFRTPPPPEGEVDWGWVPDAFFYFTLHQDQYRHSQIFGLQNGTFFRLDCVNDDLES